MSAVSKHRLLGPGIVVAGTAVACTAIWFGDPTTPGGPLPLCPTKALLNINCPGCGAMRCVYSLMHGDLPAALHYNAFAVVALGLLAYAFVAYTIGLWSGRRIRSWQHLRYSANILLVVVCVWFVIRNIPVEPFRSLRV